MTQEPGHSLRGRAPYLPIHKRPRLRLPGDARVAVWTIVNVENWLPTGPMPRTVLPPPMGAPLLPDVPNWRGTNTACAWASGASSRCWTRAS